MLILGGGFGGLYAARKLERVLPAGGRARDGSFNNVNFMLYTPLLPVSRSRGRVGAASRRRAAARAAQALDHLELARVTGAAPERKEVTSASPRATRGSSLDQLIVTLGSTSRSLPSRG